MDMENKGKSIESRCYSIEDVMGLLGVCRYSVMKLLKANEFKWLKIGPNYRISRQSFDSWLEEKLG